MVGDSNLSMSTEDLINSLDVLRESVAKRELVREQIVTQIGILSAENQRLVSKLASERCMPARGSLALLSRAKTDLRQKILLLTEEVGTRLTQLYKCDTGFAVDLDNFDLKAVDCWNALQEMQTFDSEHWQEKHNLLNSKSVSA